MRPSFSWTSQLFPLNRPLTFYRVAQRNSSVNRKRARATAMALAPDFSSIGRLLAVGLHAGQRVGAPVLAAGLERRGRLRTLEEDVAQQEHRIGGVGLAVIVGVQHLLAVEDHQAVG